MQWRKHYIQQQETKWEISFTLFGSRIPLSGPEAGPEEEPEANFENLNKENKDRGKVLQESEHDKLCKACNRQVVNRVLSFRPRAAKRQNSVHNVSVACFTKFIMLLLLQRFASILVFLIIEIFKVCPQPFIISSVLRLYTLSIFVFIFWCFLILIQARLRAPKGGFGPRTASGPERGILYANTTGL
jgi:hypothetical protein